MNHVGRSSRFRSCTLIPTPTRLQTIAQLHQFATDSGYQLRGKHHEIYLSDPRRTAPEKLRTATGQPVAALPD